jgi:hypothetical protein
MHRKEKTYSLAVIVANGAVGLRRVAALACALSLVTACGGSGGDAGDGGGGTGGTNGSGTIGASGGTVSLPSGPSVVVPSGALPGNTPITVAASTAAAPAGAVSSLYQFGPEGTTFSTPVTVSFPVPAGTKASDVSIYWTKKGSTTEWDVLPATVSGTTATASVTHFSAGFVGAACTAGMACIPANTCHTGVTTCNGTPACSDTATSAADGTACGSGLVCSAGTCGPVGVQPPGAPTGVTVLPGAGSATVSWTGSAGATSYRVYFATTPGVTTASPSLIVTGSPAAVGSLGNATAYYFAVAARNAAGESPLSPVQCGVPTAGMTTGLTLYDPLCGAQLDGKKWSPPGAGSIGVAGGAAVLGVDVGNQEPWGQRAAIYNATANVVTGGKRVTTLRADVNVPAATASRSGSSQIRAAVRLLYSPPQHRLAYPGGNQDLLVVEIGLLDDGNGLQALRQVFHCDDASCVTFSGTGVAFVDPAPFQLTGTTGTHAVAAASYDTTYTVTASLDETAGTFHWSIAGGTFGGGVSGTADPSAYLAATPGWSGVPLAGSGFFTAQIAARTLDGSAAGGGSGRITARFNSVSVGFDNAAASPFDNFSGTAGNSGPTELDAARWFLAGATSISMVGGALREEVRWSPSTVGPGNTAVRNIGIASPTGIDTLQADLTILSSTNGGGASNVAGLTGRFYNDGTPGTTAPNVNVANSAVGDVVAWVYLNWTAKTAGFTILRCTNATCGTNTVLGIGTIPGVTVGLGITHTMRLSWDPVAHRFTFGADGQTVVVDPTVTGTFVTQAAPYVKPANSPNLTIFNTVVGTVGASAANVVKVNNVFTAP